MKQLVYKASARKEKIPVRVHESRTFLASMSLSMSSKDSAEH